MQELVGNLIMVDACWRRRARRGWSTKRVLGLICCVARQGGSGRGMDWEVDVLVGGEMWKLTVWAWEHERFEKCVIK